MKNVRIAGTKTFAAITWACGFCKYVVKSRPKMRLHLSRAHGILRMNEGAMPIARKQFSRIHFRKLPLLSITQERMRVSFGGALKLRDSHLLLHVEGFDARGEFAYGFSHEMDLYDRVHRLPKLLRDLALKVEESERMKSNSEYWSSGAGLRQLQRQLKNKRKQN